MGLSLFVVLANRGVSGQERESWARCFRSSAESLSLHIEDPWAIRKRVTEVTLSFTARDRHGFVQELAPEDVHVTEDGRPIVRMWAFQNQRDLPLRLGLLIDTSGSVNPHFRLEQESAIQFLRRMVRPHWDLAFVMGFSDHMRYTTDFSDDIDSLAVGVSSLENRGGTALFDAIQQASNKLAAVPDEQSVARALIILSDGDDTSSRATFRQALDSAAKQDVTLYTIDTRVERISNVTLEGDAVLRRLAEQTGGRFLSHMNARGLATAFASIEGEMRNRFTVSYRPPDPTDDGRFHRIHITAQRSGRKFRVSARKGYYARWAPFTE